MENKTIKQNANNIMWVEYWIQKAHPSFEEYVLTAKKYDSQRWICEINLPLINKIVKSISKKEVDAMLSASKKAAKFINEYMNAHPELEIRNIFKRERWEIISDENGKYLSKGMNSEWKEIEDKKTEKIAIDSLETIKKVIRKIARINGTSKNLFIQVLDQSLFGKDKSMDDIMCEVNEKLEHAYNTSNVATCYSKEENSVIVLGYAFQSK